MPQDSTPQRRAFITCAARAVVPVARLLAEVEHLLLDAGWRTRIPNRFAASAGMGLEERQRLAEATRREIQRASVLVHVPGPAHIAGVALHRELGRALRHEVPIIVVVVAADRERLAVGLPDQERIEALVAKTDAHVLDRLDDLVSLSDRIGLPPR